YLPIDPKALPYWRISGALTGLVYWLALAGLIALCLLSIWPRELILPGALLVLALTVYSVLLAPSIRWRTWRYLVTEQQIELRYGVLIRHHVIIPMVRVQHVDTEQGPLLKSFGLSTVIIATAAGRHHIPALADAVAAELREKISLLARVVDEDV
ncbi:MAG: PH domain-containing protein, partial [Syntrophomonadaceae bacterium]|nr:PH domain-containing protein [Syntrophomonadaceae bacterium]